MRRLWRSIPAVFLQWTVLCSTMIWLFLIVEEKGNLQDVTDADSGLGDASKQQLQIKRDRIGSSIFFLETSGLECLTRRQICSVESAACSNPNTPIKIIFVKDLPTTVSTAKTDPIPQSSTYRDCKATANLLNFPNVAFHYSTFADLVEDSVLKTLALTGKLSKSNFPTYHLSDALRIVVLKKYGGWYLDLDCLVFRSLVDIQNAVGMRDASWVENGVMAFEADHPFLSFYETKFVKHFSSDIYDANGSSMLASALREYCNITTFFPISYVCHNSIINLRPPGDFYFVHHSKREWFYSNNFPDHADRAVKQNYLSHVYENEEGLHKATPGTLYAILAKEFCPVVYQRSIELKGYF